MEKVLVFFTSSFGCRMANGKQNWYRNPRALSGLVYNTNMMSWQHQIKSSNDPCDVSSVCVCAVHAQPTHYCCFPSLNDTLCFRQSGHCLFTKLPSKHFRHVATSSIAKDHSRKDWRTRSQSVSYHNLITYAHRFIINSSNTCHSFSATCNIPNATTNNPLVVVVVLDNKYLLPVAVAAWISNSHINDCVSQKSNSWRVFKCHSLKKIAK